MTTTPKPDRPCAAEVDCPRPARLAIRTTRPSRAAVRVTVYTDDREAPKTASVYCKLHGAELLASLIEFLVDADEEPKEEATHVP